MRYIILIVIFILSYTTTKTIGGRFLTDGNNSNIIKHIYVGNTKLPKSLIDNTVIDLQSCVDRMVGFDKLIDGNSFAWSDFIVSRPVTMSVNICLYAWTGDFKYTADANFTAVQLEDISSYLTVSTKPIDGDYIETDTKGIKWFIPRI
jgi:hypothetical protein